MHDQDRYAEEIIEAFTEWHDGELTHAQLIERLSKLPREDLDRLIPKPTQPQHIDTSLRRRLLGSS